MGDLGQVRVQVAVAVEVASTARPRCAARGASRPRGRRRASRGPARGRTCSGAEHGRVLGDHAGVLRLGEDVERPAHAQRGGSLEHTQVEFPPDDGRHVEHLDRVVGQVGHAPAQQGADLLRDSAGRVVGDHACHLTEEERVAAGRHVQASDERARRIGAGGPREIGLNLVEAQPLERDARGHAGELGERLGPLVLVEPRARGRRRRSARARRRRPRWRTAASPARRRRRRAGRPAGRSAAAPSRSPRGTGRRRRTTGSARSRIGGLAGGSREPLEVAPQRPTRLDPGPVGGRTALFPSSARPLPASRARRPPARAPA